MNCHFHKYFKVERFPCWRCQEWNFFVEPDRVNCQAVLVDVPLLLKDVVEVPDLDAPVDGGSDNTVVSANHQRLDLHNSLEEKGVPYQKSRTNWRPGSERPSSSPSRQSSCPSRAVLAYWKIEFQNWRQNGFTLSLWLPACHPLIWWCCCFGWTFAESKLSYQDLLLLLLNVVMLLSKTSPSFTRWSSLMLYK